MKHLICLTILTWSVSFGFFGCASKAAKARDLGMNWSASQLQPGMTESDVISMYGKPSNVDSSGDVLVWNYEVGGDSRWPRVESPLINKLIFGSSDSDDSPLLIGWELEHIDMNSYQRPEFTDLNSRLIRQGMLATTVRAVFGKPDVYLLKKYGRLTAEGPWTSLAYRYKMDVDDKHALNEFVFSSVDGDWRLVNYNLNYMSFQQDQ